jgi:CheY-like chemotaxis protein
MTDAPAQGTCPIRVLVVDDDEDTRVSTCALLDLWGYECRQAADGKSAIAVATEFRPHVVFLDVNMPGPDGIETARRLRDTPGVAQSVIVAMTGYGRGEDVARTKAAGFTCHAVKPADPEKLRRLLAWSAEFVRSGQAGGLHAAYDSGPGCEKDRDSDAPAPPCPV